MNTPEDDEGPIAGIERLRRDIPPQRDLWPEIRARIGAQRPARVHPVAARRWLPLALAASVVAGLAGVLTLGLRPDATPADPAPVAVASATRPLSFDTAAIVKANLDMVGDAERQLRSALRSDPGSASLRELLAAAEGQRRELDRMLQPV